MEFVEKILCRSTEKEKEKEMFVMVTIVAEVVEWVPLASASMVKI